MKKKFKMPSAFTVLFLIIIFVAALTWIIPAGQYETDKSGNIDASSYEQIDQQPQGLWDVATAPINGMIGTDTTDGAISVSLFIIVIGGFLGVVQRTGAIDAGIGSVVKKSKGKEKRLIPILMLIFALGGTTYGMAEETMAFYPLLIPVIIAAGFDTLTAVAIIFLGAGAGTLASTVNPFATGVASQSLGISIGDGIVIRLLLFVLCVGVSILYVYRYASKVEKDPTKSLIADQMPEHKKHFAIVEDVATTTRKQKQVLWLFCISFVVMIASLVPWSQLNENWTIFNTINSKIKEIPFIGDFYGQSSLPLGEWYFTEITMLFLVMSIVIGLVARMKESDIVDSFVDGAKDLLSVALIVGLARGIQVIMNDGMITDTVLHWGADALSGLPPAIFSVLTFVFYLPMSFLIPSTSGLASATMPIIGGLAPFVDVPQHIVVTAYQSASGIVNLITPTSAVLMGALAIAKVNYGTWLKFVGKLIAILIAINVVVLVLATMVS